MRKIIVSLLLGALLAAALAVPAAAADRMTVEAPKIEKAPVIDGVITEEEWGKPFFSDAPQDHEDFVGVSDSAVYSVYPENIELYTRWDDKCLYIGAVVTEKKYYNVQKGQGGWNGDSIEIDIVAEGKPQAVRFRTNLSCNSKDGTSSGWYHNRPNAALDGRDDFPAEFSAENGAQAIAKANGNVVTYEWAFDWDFVEPTSTIKEGYKVIVNYQFHLTDDGSAVEYMNYATLDDAGSKQYPEVVLTAAPKAAPETTAAPAVTAPTTSAPAVTPSAPATFDAAVLAAAAAALSMTGCVVFRKKK